MKTKVKSILSELKKPHKSIKTSYVNGLLIFYSKNDIEIFLESTEGDIINGLFVECKNDKNSYLSTSEDNLTDITSFVKNNSNKLDIASKFCGKDDLRPVMNGVFIDRENIVGTDAHILYKSKHYIENVDFEINIPSVFIPFVLEAQEVFVGLKKIVCIFENGEVAETNLISEKYPNYKAIIPSLHQYSNSFDIDTKNDVFKRSLKLSEKDVYGSTHLFKDDKKLFYIQKETQVREDFDFQNEIKDDSKNLSEDEIILLMPVRTEFELGFAGTKIDKISKAVRENNLTINYFNKDKVLIVTI